MPAYETPVVDGAAVERVWTLIAAEIAGEPVPAGERRIEREAWFSMRGAAVDWLRARESEGFTELIGPVPLATSYHGPSDSPSNAWAVRASRLLADVTNDGMATLEQLAEFEEWSR